MMNEYKTLRCDKIKNILQYYNYNIILFDSLNNGKHTTAEIILEPTKRYDKNLSHLKGGANLVHLSRYYY